MIRPKSPLYVHIRNSVASLQSLHQVVLNPPQYLKVAPILHLWTINTATPAVGHCESAIVNLPHYNEASSLIPTCK